MDFGIINKPRKKLCGYENKQHPSIKFEDLPRDISIDIISRLPITSLVKFGSVSQLCHQLSHDPTLVSPYFPRSIENNPILLFLSFPSTRYLYFVELSGHGNKETVRKIQIPFSGANIVASCNGILCLLDCSSKLHVYNPFTNRHKELITSFCDQREVFLGFGYHPIAKEYMIIKASKPYPPFNKKPYIRLCSLKHYSCVRKVKAPHHLELSSRPSPAFVHGRFHWFSIRFLMTATKPTRLVWVRKILSFDLSDEQFRVISIPIRDTNYLENCHLTVLGGFLSAVFCHFRARFDIWVMKKYGVRKSWKMILCVKQRWPFQEKQLRKHIEVERVVCVLENGNILVLFSCGVLASYDLDSGEATELVLWRKPPKFDTVVHVPSLNWIDTLNY